MSNPLLMFAETALIMAGFSVTCLAATGPAGREGDPRPNIILILTDDQGYGDVGFNGNDVLETPNLDRFAEQGIRFDRFYVAPVSAQKLTTGSSDDRPSIHGA